VRVDLNGLIVISTDSGRISLKLGRSSRAGGSQRSHCDLNRREFELFYLALWYGQWRLMDETRIQRIFSGGAVDFLNRNQ
jgi:hypothetical protein